MSRVHALCGVSASAIGLALVAPAPMVSAQTGGQALPPVTVDAPASVRPKLAKPKAHTASAARGQPQTGGQSLAAGAGRRASFLSSQACKAKSPHGLGFSAGEADES